MRGDLITQEIWHFIGLFDQIVEQARQRIDYDGFRGAADGQAEMEMAAVSPTTPHPDAAAPEFRPKTGNPAPAEAATSGLVTEPRLDLSAPAQDRTAPPPASANPDTGAPVNLSGSAGSALPDLPPPGSVMIVMRQSNVATDSDLLLMTPAETAFLDPAIFADPLQDLMAVAQSLGVIGALPMPSDQASIAEMGRALQAAVEAAAPAAVAGADVFIARGTDTLGVHVNGVAADDLPVLQDHLPEVPDAPKTSVEIAQATAAQEETPAPDIDHLVLAGGNTVVNEALVSISWLDAPVITVMGGLIRIDAISQINVSAESQWLDGVPLAPVEAPQGLINSALFDRPDAGTAGTEDGGSPLGWIVTTVAGDLIVLNWITQTNFLIDTDILSVALTGSTSYIVTGDNTLVNTADLLELSWSYDLIVIGGSMIDLALIRQTNVLHDVDAVTGGLADMGGNLLWNQAVISDDGLDTIAPMAPGMAGLANAAAKGGMGLGQSILNDPAFDGLDLLRVLHIEGDLLMVQAIDQTNVMGDADQVAMAAGAAMTQEGAEISLITGANALINIAEIASGGMDSTIHVQGEAYSDALLYQANFFGDPEDGVAPGLQGLVAEAVAFLADDMIAEGDAPDPAVLDAALHGIQTDGLNVMLA